MSDFGLNALILLCRVASSIDAVLLSHPDTMHLGALPYAMKHLGLSAPVYATEPVFRLGLLTMYDHYLSRKVKYHPKDVSLKESVDVLTVIALQR